MLSRERCSQLLIDAGVGAPIDEAALFKGTFAQIAEAAVDRPNDEEDAPEAWRHERPLLLGVIAARSRHLSDRGVAQGVVLHVELGRPSLLEVGVHLLGGQDRVDVAQVPEFILQTAPYNPDGSTRTFFKPTSPR